MNRTICGPLLALMLVSCARASTNTPSVESDAGARSEDSGTLSEPLVLGQSCVTGCAGADICANPSEECALGYCLFDGRDGFDAYCTMSCSAASCPSGYHCEAIGFAIERACVADSRVCGDHVVQRGEACDDGNRVSGDGCVADCSSLDVPLARVRVELTVRYDEDGERVERTTEFDVQVDDSSVKCPRAYGLGAGSSPTSWRRFSLESCGPDVVRFEFTAPYVQGSFTEETSSSPYFQVYVQRADWPVPVIYAPSSVRANDEELVVLESSAVGGLLGANGTFEAILPFSNSDLTCVPEREGCPMVSETMEIEGTFSLRTAE